MKATCSGCDTVWTHAEAIGHCSGCHQTWLGARAFDAHQTIVDGCNHCYDPRTFSRSPEDPTLRFEAVQAPARLKNGVLWRLRLTEKQRANHERWLDRLKADKVRAQP